MKVAAEILLLLYQLGVFIVSLRLKEDFEKDLRNKATFIMLLIPIVMCIILAM